MKILFILIALSSFVYIKLYGSLEVKEVARYSFVDLCSASKDVLSELERRINTVFGLQSEHGIEPHVWLGNNLLYKITYRINLTADKINEVTACLQQVGDSDYKPSMILYRPSPTFNFTY